MYLNTIDGYLHTSKDVLYPVIECIEVFENIYMEGDSASINLDTLGIDKDVWLYNTL